MVIGLEALVFYFHMKIDLGPTSIHPHQFSKPNAYNFQFLVINITFPCSSVTRYITITIMFKSFFR